MLLKREWHKLSEEKVITEFEDISSSSKKPAIVAKDVADKAKKVAKEATKVTKKAVKTTVDSVDKYGSAGITNIDKIIKAIAFVVSIAVLLLFVAAAVILFILDKMFMILSAVIIAIGIVIALISLFLIYGLGQIISQNNEILKKL